MKTKINEEAFYGMINKTYRLEGSNLRENYENICRQFTANTNSKKKGRYYIGKIPLAEAAIFVDYCSGKSNDLITINFISFIANIFFSPKTKRLETLFDNIIKKDKFQLRRIA